METVPLEKPRYRKLGPCPTGFIWFDSRLGLYPIFGPDIDPNQPHRSVEDARKRTDDKAGWHSR